MVKKSKTLQLNRATTAKAKLAIAEEIVLTKCKDCVTKFLLDMACFPMFPTITQVSLFVSIVFPTTNVSDLLWRWFCNQVLSHFMYSPWFDWF